MKRRILALILVAVLIFSMTACKSADDEESAVSGDITSSNTNTDSPSTDTNDSTDSSNNQTPDTNQNDSQQPDTDTQKPDTTPENNEQENNDPPVDTSKPTYTVTLDYGFDNRTDTKTVNDKVTDPEIVRRGYKLLGWFNGDKKWDFNNTVTGNITITARWSKETYTITYDAGDATVPSSNPKTYDVESNIELAPAQMAGKAFETWSIYNGVETITSNSITPGMAGDLVLTPVWDETAFVFGRYEQDGNTDNGAEPIVWTKLKEENGKVLLISKDILDCKQYDKANGDSIRWNSCGLRNFLNNSFYKMAFNSDEKSAIVQTEIKTPGKNDGSTSKDYVFTLSIEEAGEYFSSNASRRAKLTKFAEANGAQNSPTGGWWWLRTKCGTWSAALIENDGNIRSIGYEGKMTTIGVRPVIWVDLSKV